MCIYTPNHRNTTSTQDNKDHTHNNVYTAILADYYPDSHENS